MNTLLTHPLFTALGDGLLHSSWLFALSCGVSLLITPRVPEARRRYRIYLLTLISLPFSFFLIVALSYADLTGRWAEAALLSAGLGAERALTLTDNLKLVGLNLEAGWTAYLAAAYLLGLIVSLPAGGYRYLLSLRLRRGGMVPPVEMRGLFAALSAELIPGREIPWRISRRVREVLTVGVFRPVILFPVGLVNGLSIPEVESILRHELIHIRRNDPFWNAIQELCQRVFFYHPLVYWLTARLDLEREYACDDAVVSSDDPVIYARALLQVAKFSLNPKKAFTMAAIDHNSFTNRLQRLFGGATEPAAALRPKHHSSFILAGLAVVPLLFMLTFNAGDGVGLASFNAAESMTASSVQEVRISGTVTDGVSGEPLIGTSILLVGTEIGTITDFTGEYTMMVPAGDIELSFSYVGYKTVTIPFDATSVTTLSTTMFKDKEGDQKVTVDPEKATSTDFKITAPGLGLGSLGDDILILVDGKLLSDQEMNKVSPADIESVNVIKDAAEIEKLGHGTSFKGAILIVTKK